MAKKKKVFYDLFVIDNANIALVDDKYKYDFWREDFYTVPLEYPHLFKLQEEGFPDYLLTTAQTVFSTRLKEIIEKYEKSVVIEWVHIKVDDNKEIRDYYMPRIQPMPYQWDVLSRGATKMASPEDTEFMVPFLCTEKVVNRDYIRMFENSLIEYVSEDVKNEMERVGITGVEYKKVRTYPDDYVRGEEKAKSRMDAIFWNKA